MVIEKNKILLLKSREDEDDKYEKLLTKNNFEVNFLPVLEFVFVNISTLKEKLENAEKYSGIIFTSPRAIAATKISLNGQQIDESWYKKNNFVVGETTFSLVKNELNLICQGKESGNANNLSDLIIQDTYDKPFLFPCGNLKKETLQVRLKEHNIIVDALMVYEAKQNRNFITNFKQITEDFTKLPEYIVFFSPSGVNFTKDLNKDCLLDKNIKLVAIGPSTEKALNNENLPVFSVAAKPTVDELLNAINSN